MRAILLGANSEIGSGLRHLLQQDGWDVTGWARLGKWPGQTVLPHEMPEWNLVIVAIGRVAPVGYWWDLNNGDWEQTVESNLLLPIRLLRSIWSKRKPNASVCWLAGSNPNMIMDGYSAYNVSKMAVLKAVEQLDHESDAKFFALGPGIVLTKIHDASKGWDNPKLKAAQKEGRSTPIERIYECLKWCIEQPKEVIGGRNVCASDPWDNPSRPRLLTEIPDMWKLRRDEG